MSTVTNSLEHKEILYLQQRAATTVAVTPSTSTFGTNTNSFVDSSHTTRTYNVNDSDIPISIASSDSIILNHAGNDTVYNQNFAIRPRRSFRLMQIVLNYAVCLNVSAYTSGVPNLPTHTTQLFHWTAGSQIPLTGSVLSWATGFSALGSAIAQIHIIRTSIPLSGVNISENDHLALNVTTQGVTTLTNTRQEGILPVFPLSATSTTKDWSVSCALFKGVALEA